MRLSKKHAPKLPQTLDAKELSKYFNNEQRQDVVDLHILCLNTIPGRLRGPRARKVDPDHIPRPVNCFMVYRKEKQEHIRKFCPTANHRNISKIIAKWWVREKPDTKKVYLEQAEKAKVEHAQKYPDYIFRPKSRREKMQAQKKACPPKPNALTIIDFNNEYLMKQATGIISQTAGYSQTLSQTIGQLGPSNAIPLLSKQLPAMTPGTQNPALLEFNSCMTNMNGAQLRQPDFIVPSVNDTLIHSFNDQQLQQSYDIPYFGDNAQFIDPTLLNAFASSSFECAQSGNDFSSTSTFVNDTHNNDLELNDYIGNLSSDLTIDPATLACTPFQTVADFTPALDNFPTPAVLQSDLMTTQDTPIMSYFNNTALLDSLASESVRQAMEDKFQHPLSPNDNTSYEFFTDLFTSLQAGFKA